MFHTGPSLQWAYAQEEVSLGSHQKFETDTGEEEEKKSASDTVGEIFLGLSGTNNDLLTNKSDSFSMSNRNTVLDMKNCNLCFKMRLR